MRDFVFYDGMISYDGELLTYDDFIRQLHLETDGHGTISASRTTGMSGDTVTLTNTPDQYYLFDNYTTTGGTIAGSTFTFGDDDDQTARANFKRNSYITGGTLIGVQASEVFKTGSNETISPFRDNNSETTARGLYHFSSTIGNPHVYSPTGHVPVFSAPADITATISAAITAYVAPVGARPSASIRVGDVTYAVKEMAWGRAGTPYYYSAQLTATDITGMPNVIMTTNFSNPVHVTSITGNWTADAVRP